MIDPVLIIAKVRALYPDLTVDVVPDDFFLAWMDWAKSFVGNGFGPFKLTATALLLAHAAYKWLFASNSGGIGGPVTSISTGVLSASFGNGGADMSGADLASTVAGSAYLALRNARASIMAPRIYL